MTKERCDDCGAADVRMHLGEAALCDRCADRRVAKIMGMPELGDPPPPVRLTSPDGIIHELRYRWSRGPVGISAELEEVGTPPGQGFQFGVLGAHDADLRSLVARLLVIAEREVGHQYLERSAIDGSWQVAAMEVTGRFVPSDEGFHEPYAAIVDGRMLSWYELGQAFRSFEGWQFHVEIGDLEDLRPDAEIVPFPESAHSADPSHGSADAPAGIDVDRLRAELRRFEDQLRTSGASTSSVRTTMQRATAFVDFLAGDDPAPRASTSLPPADVDTALRWAQDRNDRLPERAIGQLRYEVDIEGMAVTMYECRPPWREGPSTEWTRFPIVRFRYTKARKEWATYWRDRNSKFHRYDPLPSSRNLQDLIDEVEADRSGIFWG